MKMNIEKTILKNLIKNDAYIRKVLPFIKEEYFVSENDRVLFAEIKKFFLEYKTLPTHDALIIEIDSIRNLRDEQIKSIKETIKEISNDVGDTNIDWLSDSTEKFCQEKAIYQAMMQSIDIMNNKNSSMTKGAIPQLLSDALGVSFDPKVGHSYTEDFEKRFEYYHRKQEKIPFDLEFFNKITGSGLPKKTLNVVLAGCVHPETEVKIRYRRKTKETF